MIRNSGQHSRIQATIIMLVALSATTAPASAEQRSPRGFAERCDLADNRSVLERIACEDPALRARDATMLGLVSQVEEETAGFDGETGKPINSIAAEQKNGGAPQPSAAATPDALPPLTTSASRKSAIAGARLCPKNPPRLPLDSQVTAPLSQLQHFG